MCLIYPVPRISKRFSVMKTWLHFLVCRVRLSRPHSENRWCPFSINKMNVWSLYFNQARGISEPSKRTEWGNHVPCQNPSEFARLCWQRIHCEMQVNSLALVWPPAPRQGGEGQQGHSCGQNPNRTSFLHWGGSSSHRWVQSHHRKASVLVPLGVQV